MDLTELSTWRELDKNELTNNQRKIASFLKSKTERLIVGNFMDEIKEMARLFGYSTISVPVLSIEDIRGTRKDSNGNSWKDAINNNPEKKYLLFFILDDADKNIAYKIAPVINRKDYGDNVLCVCIYVDKNKYVKIPLLEEYADTLDLETEDDRNLGKEIHTIDLGLPSGLLWADRNLGADNRYPEMLGYYWAWGQAQQLMESRINKDNYHFFIDKDFLKNEDAKYQLSKYEDAAYCNLGSGWRIPTHDDFKELMEYCKVGPATRNNIPGVEFVGPNGNSIFIPYSGNECEMWCSGFSCYDEEEDDFYAESFGYPGYEEDEEIINLLESTCYDTLQIRPVFESPYKNKKDTNNKIKQESNSFEKKNTSEVRSAQSKSQSKVNTEDCTPKAVTITAKNTVTKNDKKQDNLESRPNQASISHQEGQDTQDPKALELMQYIENASKSLDTNRSGEIYVDTRTEYITKSQYEKLLKEGKEIVSHNKIDGFFDKKEKYSRKITPQYFEKLQELNFSFGRFANVKSFIEQQKVFRARLIGKQLLDNIQRKKEGYGELKDAEDCLNILKFEYSSSSEIAPLIPQYEAEIEKIRPKGLIGAIKQIKSNPIGCMFLYGGIGCLVWLLIILLGVLTEILAEN